MCDQINEVLSKKCSVSIRNGNIIAGVEIRQRNRHVRLQKCNVSNLHTFQDRHCFLVKSCWIAAAKTNM